MALFRTGIKISSDLDVENFENIELDEFDTLIIPSGYYGI